MSEQWYMKRLITSKDNIETYIDHGAESYQKFATDGANDECQKRAQKWYLQVRLIRDLIFHDMIEVGRSQVPSTRSAAEGYCGL